MQEKPANSGAGLVLAAPFLLLMAAAIISWPWRVLGLPGTIGTVSPPSTVLLVLTVVGGVWATARRLPMPLITWPPAGLGAVFFLTVGFGTQHLAPAASPVVLLGYFIVFVFVFFISMAIGKYGVSYAVSFTCLFLMTQAVQVPVFELDGPGVTGASVWTGAAAVRAAMETAVLVWLAHRLAFKADASHFWIALALVGLVVAHGPMSAWEQPLKEGIKLTGGTYGAVALAWVLFAGIQLAVVAVTARLRQGWSREPLLGPEAAAPPPAKQSRTEEPRKKGPTPRSRRRR